MNRLLSKTQGIRPMKRKRVFVATAVTVLGIASTTFAQEAAEPAQTKPVVFTTAQDHQNMMQQLGITKLRPGPSGNPDAPNATNTDESKANPYPTLPELMKLKDGTAVTTPEQWWSKRRPEIVEARVFIVGGNEVSSNYVAHPSYCDFRL